MRLTVATFVDYYIPLDCKLVIRDGSRVIFNGTRQDLWNADKNVSKKIVNTIEAKENYIIINCRQ